MPRAELSAQLVAWIEAIGERCIVVTDSPNYDFELIKPLLNPWPSNLARQAMIFDSYAMGTELQAWLAGVMADYHIKGRPEHHAVYDAQALRAGMQAARAKGWIPKWERVMPASQSE